MFERIRQNKWRIIVYAIPLIASAVLAVIAGVNDPEQIAEAGRRRGR